MKLFITCLFWLFCLSAETKASVFYILGTNDAPAAYTLTATNISYLIQTNFVTETNFVIETNWVTETNFLTETNFVTETNIVIETNSMMAAAYTEITNNLVLWYPLAGDVDDHWGNDSASAQLTPVWTSGPSGAADTALFLSGAQGLTANDGVLPLGNSPRTISFWLYLTSLPSSGTVSLLFQYGSLSYGDFMNCYLQNNSGTGEIEIYLGGNGNGAILFPFNPPLNQWFQLTVEMDSSQTVYLFENGVNLVGDSQALQRPANTVAGGTLYLGFWNNINYASGAMADFRVYNASLTQSQLMTDFLAVYTNPTALPQLLYLKMQDDINTAPAYSYTNWPAPLVDSSLKDSSNIIYNDPSGNDNTAWVSGPDYIGNSALHFHGVPPSYIETHDNTDFAFTNQSYSINFWVEPQTASGTFLSCGIANESGWAIKENGIYNAYFYTYSNGTSSAIGGGNLNVQNSSWNDVCITVSNGTNLCAYLNGGLEYSGMINLPLTPGTNTLWLGQQNLGGGADNNLDGDLWLPQIWNTALSPNDVSKLYYEQMNGTPWP